MPTPHLVKQIPHKRLTHKTEISLGKSPRRKGDKMLPEAFAKQTARRLAEEGFEVDGIVPEGLGYAVYLQGYTKAVRSMQEAREFLRDCTHEDLYSEGWYRCREEHKIECPMCGVRYCINCQAYDDHTC